MTEDELRDELRAAYLAGCRATHKSVQDEPSLALESDPEFGEAADDYVSNLNLRRKTDV